MDSCCGIAVGIPRHIFQETCYLFSVFTETDSKDISSYAFVIFLFFQKHFTLRQLRRSDA
jgi:hypothetical protein